MPVSTCTRYVIKINGKYVTSETDLGSDWLGPVERNTLDDVQDVIFALEVAKTNKSSSPFKYDSRQTTFEIVGYTNDFKSAVDWAGQDDEAGTRSILVLDRNVNGLTSDINEALTMSRRRINEFWIKTFLDAHVFLGKMVQVVEVKETTTITVEEV